VPLTSITRDAETLTMTVVGDYPVAQQRLWRAFTDPRQLERFWGPPGHPVTCTHHDLRPGGRAEYVMTFPDGEKLGFSWVFGVIDPISSFEARDGDDDDENGPSSMTFTFATTATGSRVTVVSRFSSLETLETTAARMEDGMRAALPQLDDVLTEGTPA
jgi:uncharacterized protein YndB with AHSA1/START domain